MKILVKDGVIIKEINWQFIYLLDTVKQTWEHHEERYPVLTSANDGKHMISSLHYKNLAWDWRIRHLTPEETKYWVQRLKQVITSDFQVILEKDHVHTEFDPN